MIVVEETQVVVVEHYFEGGDAAEAVEPCCGTEMGTRFRVVEDGAEDVAGAGRQHGECRVGSSWSP